MSNGNHSHAWGDSRIWNLKTSPAYPDVCGHPPGSFVGSIVYWQGQKERVADVYVFEDRLGDNVRQSVCIRCSKEGGDYISPGTVLDLLISAQREGSASCPVSPVYQAAAALIDEKFKVKFERVP